MAENHETAKMAIIPVSSPSPKPVSEPVSPENENNSRVALHLDAVASGFKVDAILSIYAGQHSASPAVKKFAKALGTNSAELNRKLKELSAEHNFPLPVTIIPVHEKELSALKGKRKGEFDAAYGAYMQHVLTERSASLQFLTEYATVPGLADFSSDYLKEVKNLQVQLKRLNR